MRGTGVAAMLAAVAVSFAALTSCSAQTPQPSAPEPITSPGAGVSGDPARPPHRVAVTGYRDSRAEKLLGILRTSVPKGLYVADSASSANAMPPSSVAYRAGLLLKSKSGTYSAISAEYTDPAVTSGDPDCAKWEYPDCSTRDIDSGTAHVNGSDRDAVISVALYRDDRSMPLILHSTRNITPASSIFWQDGSPSGGLPINVDGLVNLAQSLNSSSI